MVGKEKECWGRGDFLCVWGQSCMQPLKVLIRNWGWNEKEGIKAKGNVRVGV